MFKKTIISPELPVVKSIYFFNRYKYPTNTYKKHKGYINVIYGLY